MPKPFPPFTERMCTLAYLSAVDLEIKAAMAWSLLVISVRVPALLWYRSKAHSNQRHVRLQAHGLHAQGMPKSFLHATDSLKLGLLFDLSPEAKIFTRCVAEHLTSICTRESPGFNSGFKSNVKTRESPLSPRLTMSSFFVKLYSVQMLSWTPYSGSRSSHPFARRLTQFYLF